MGLNIGDRLGQVVSHGINKHFEAEVKAYCERHNMKPDELSINMQPGKKDKIILTLGPNEEKLILPKRVFTFTVKLSDAENVCQSMK